MLAALVATVAASPSWTLVLTGDAMLNGIPPSRKPFAPIASILRGADLTLVNLEIPLTNQGQRTPRKTPAELARRTQFILRADPGHAPHLREVGIDLVSLGNNHAMDYGPAGLRQMLSLLDRQGIGYAGAGENWKAARRVAVKTLPNGTRVGLISALAFMSRGALRKNWPAEGSKPGLSVLAYDGVVNERAKKDLKNWIGTARRECDVLIVALHWGIEKQTVPTPYQVSLGRAAIDSGADIVWGHHPHVLQGAESYRGRPIFYSLGNLVSPLPGSTGIVRLTMTGAKVTRTEFLPAQIAGGRVRPGGDPRRMKTLSELLRRRYPNRQSAPLP